MHHYPVMWNLPLHGITDSVSYEVGFRSICKPVPRNGLKWQ
jgi:hypothetical protein